MFCRFRNVARYDADHTGLYLYTDPATGQKRLAKFTGRYGTQVHAAWAPFDLAPTLFDVEELECHIILVTMELLPETWQVLSDVSDSELIMMSSKPYVLQALAQAQNVLVKGLSLELTVTCGSQTWQYIYKANNGMSNS